MVKPDIIGREANRPTTGRGRVENSLPYIKAAPAKPVRKDRSRAILRECSSGTVSSLDTLEVPPLMTVEELAILLQTSKGAVYARLARGGIPGALRLGRTLRFDRRVIVHWLSANSTSAGGQS